MAGWPTPRCAESLRVNTNAAARSAVKPVEARGQCGGGGGGGGNSSIAADDGGRSVWGPGLGSAVTFARW